MLYFCLFLSIVKFKALKMVQDRHIIMICNENSFLTIYDMGVTPKGSWAACIMSNVLHFWLLFSIVNFKAL